MALLKTIFSVSQQTRFQVSCVVLIFASLTGVCQAEGEIWQMLERDGDVLDLMAMEAIADRVLVVGARYEEQQWQGEKDPPDEQTIETVVRKPLHIISLNSREQVEWQHSYPAIPDVNEIFSVSTTKNGHLCIAYGRNYVENEFINPVVLQVDAKGKITWADLKAIPESSLPDTSELSYLQIANLESIRVVGTPDNGCLLGYILRHESKERETLQLNLIMINKEGDAKWHFKRETALYGKMFLVKNADADDYIVIQTNQSRDAAIQAMMAGQPFSPKTSMLVVSDKGELKKFYDYEKLNDLSKVWVKHAADAMGEKILLAGNSKNAWVGFIDEDGRVNKINNNLVGEFSYVGNNQSNGYILVRGASIVALDKQLNLQLDKTIDQIIKKKYANAYLEKQLPEQGPIQNIVPLTKNAYLILYKLASRLQKIVLP